MLENSIILVTGGTGSFGQSFVPLTPKKYNPKKIIILSPSMTITDMARAISPAAEQKIIGIRPGEKMHEQMIGVEDAPFTYEYDGYYKIFPQIFDRDKDRIGNGKPVPEGFIYSSDNNSEWMSIEALQQWMGENQGKLYA